MHSIGFIEHLADADGAAWQENEMVAGFLTLRVTEDALDTRASVQQIETARQWASKVTRLSTRRRLLDLLNILGPGEATEDTRASIARALLALGSDLHADGSPKPAIAVFRVVDRYFGREAEWRLAALQGIAYSNRMLKQHTEASMAYEMMLSVAAEHRHPRMELEAMLGLGKVAFGRGNIPAAADAVAKVIPRARRLHVRELLGRALIDRGTINGTRLDHVAAILDFNEALDFADPPNLRDNAMFNMATALREVDFPAAARDIAVYLWYNAVELELRWHAGVLRYNLAIDREDWGVAKRVHEQLDAANLSPQPDAEYHEALARDHAKRGLFDAAAEAAEAMREIARAHEMYGIEHRAEQALLDIVRGIVPSIYTFRPVETTKAAKRKLAAVERSVAKLCAL